MNVTLQEEIHLGKRLKIKAKKAVEYRVLYLFLLPAILSCLIFNYRPMVGVVMAFQDYNVIKGLWGSPFVGLHHFKEFLQDPYFYKALKNTIGINGLSILIGYPLPIIFALVIFSIKNGPFKRITQTISYLPHFISWVVVAGLVYRVLDEYTGMVNMIIKALGHPPVSFLSNPSYFWILSIAVGIWKEVGWYTILYLAALAGVDAEQYEAADIDGATGFNKLIYITLPGISTTIGLTIILSAGSLISASGYAAFVPFDAIFNLRNPLISSTANTIDFYVYQSGIMGTKYSYSTAIGITQSSIAFCAVFFANWLSKKTRGYGVF